MSKLLFMAITCVVATPLVGLGIWAVTQSFGPLRPESWAYIITSSVFTLGASIWAGNRVWDDREDLRGRVAEALNEENEDDEEHPLHRRPIGG